MQICNAAELMLSDKIRWTHQGRQPKHGLDCLGLVVCAYERAGISLTDGVNYSRNPDPDEIVRGLSGQGEQITAPELGSVLLIKIGRIAIHFALYVTGGRIIHAYEGAGRVVAHPWRGAWQRRTVSIWRIR